MGSEGIVITIIIRIVVRILLLLQPPQLQHFRIKENNNPKH